MGSAAATMRGHVWRCTVLDADSDRCAAHATVVNGVVGDPIGRLLREASRGLGVGRSEDIQLRYVPRRFNAEMFRDYRATWGVSVELTPDVVEWSLTDPPTFAVRRRAALPPVADGTVTAAAVASPPPPPQRVDAATPDGFTVRAAFSLAAADPLADLIESVANAGLFCTDDGLELRAVTGALPRPLTPLHLLSASTLRELWERSAPLFPDRMPAPGQAVVGRFVDVPGLPLERCCGACSW
jgi:hypothetical protein